MTQAHREEVLQSLHRLSGGVANTLIHVEQIQTGLTEQEFVTALNSLEARGYVEPKKAFGGNILGVKITRKGVLAVEDGEQPNTPQMNINGGTNYIQNGNHNSQNITIGITEEQVQRLVSALRQDGENELADAIDTEVVQTKQPHRIREHFSKLFMAAVNAGVSAATTVELTHLLQ